MLLVAPTAWSAGASLDRDPGFRVPLPACWRDVTVRRCFAVDRQAGIVWMDDWANDQLLIRGFDGALVRAISYHQADIYGQAAEDSWYHLVLSLACVPGNGVFVLSGTEPPRVTALDRDGKVLYTYRHLSVPFVSGLLRLCADQAGSVYVPERFAEVPGRGSPFAVGLTKCGGDGTPRWWLQFAGWGYGFGVAPEGTTYLVNPGSKLAEVYSSDGNITRLFPLSIPPDLSQETLGVLGVDRDHHLFLVLGSDTRRIVVYDSNGNMVSGRWGLAAQGGADRTPMAIDELGSLYFATAESDGLYLARTQALAEAAVPSPDS